MLFRSVGEHPTYADRSFVTVVHPLCRQIIRWGIPYLCRQIPSCCFSILYRQISCRHMPSEMPTDSIWWTFANKQVADTFYSVSTHIHAYIMYQYLPKFHKNSTSHPHISSHDNNKGQQCIQFKSTSLIQVVAHQVFSQTQST